MTLRIVPRTVVRYRYSVDISEAEAMLFVFEHVNPYPDYDVRKFGTITVIDMS